MISNRSLRSAWLWLVCVCLLTVGTSQSVQSQDDVPCAWEEVTCGGGDGGDGGGSGPCVTTYSAACSSCGSATICEIFPSLCTVPHSGREGTNIKRTRCPGQPTAEEWTDAPCGYCIR